MANGSAKRKLAKQRQMIASLHPKPQPQPEPEPEPEPKPKAQPKLRRVKPFTSNRTPAPFPLPLIDAPAPPLEPPLPNSWKPRRHTPTDLMDQRYDEQKADPDDLWSRDRDLDDEKRDMIQEAFRLLFPTGKEEVKQFVLAETNAIMGPTTTWLCEQQHRTLTILTNHGEELANTHNKKTIFPDRAHKQFVHAMHRIFVSRELHGTMLVADVWKGGMRHEYINLMALKMRGMLEEFMGDKEEVEGLRRAFAEMNR